MLHLFTSSSSYLLLLFCTLMSSFSFSFVLHSLFIIFFIFAIFRSHFQCIFYSFPFVISSFSMQFSCKYYCLVETREEDKCFSFCGKMFVYSLLKSNPKIALCANMSYNVLPLYVKTLRMLCYCICNIFL